MSYIGTEPKDIRSFGRTKFDYTATQGQTAFTGADDDGKVLAFTTGQIEVFVNGILMDESDFTTTGTGTVTLASAANLNDVISIVSFESNIPDNDYVPASGGTFTGNVTHSGTVTNNGNVGINTTPTAKLHIDTGTSTNDFDQVLIEGSSVSGSSNPEITLQRNDSAPADNDYVGGINFYGKNSADENIKYAQIVGRTIDVSDASEDGALAVFTEGAGIQRETLFVSATGSRLRTNSLRIASHLTSGLNSAGPTIGLIRNDTTTGSGNVLGTFGFGHTDGTPDFPDQTPQQLPASIRAVAAESMGSGDDGANMEFYTKPINGNKDVSSTLNMKIANDGIITMPNQPSFTAHRNVDQDITQSSTNVGLVFDAVDHNIGNHYSTTTGRFTCPVDGVYFISFSIRLDFLASTYAWCYPFVNGSPVYDSGGPNFITQDTGSYTTLAAAGQLSLNANDYVQIYAYVSGDSDWDFENASNFSMRLMG